MEILFVVDGYPAPGLPYSAFIGVLCEELLRQGHNINVIAPQSITRSIVRKVPLAPKYTVANTFGDNSIKVYRPYVITFGNGILKRLGLWLTKAVVQFEANRKEINPDICYAHFWYSAYNILGWASSKKKPLFVATGEDKIEIQNYIAPKTINKLREYVSGVICVSTKNLEESVSLGLADKNKCIVLPNSIDNKLFYKKDKAQCRRQLGFPDDAFIVAFCGRFIHRKGVKRVSDAIKMTGDPDIKSIFIGSDYENENENPDCDGILFKGSLPHEEIPDYLNCADVYVLPTLAEGCSNSIVEAMACGLPIISSNLPFNYDILNDNNSIVVDPLNVSQIADVIIQLKNDDELRKKLSKGVLVTASGLTIEMRATKLIQFINEKII